ncbi:hypothetical protein B0I08_10144 [Glaciihabitans tibetensis]|uniref:Uncharacterized protein n=1 Tax=Glaciihabitans tibetensis TaxID=1266600 RepID=A0A2T0VI79_9MICO|nr:hypothetical protein [Glaciihabitans tibetensis]PRY69922.1 hypothetical protein B0I08_10144 [Glaciihabitans tibetensis]
MSEGDPPPLTGLARVVSLAAIMFTVVAGTIFVMVIVLGSGGDTTLAAVFGPVAIGATILGLASAVSATVRARTRVLGILCLLVLLPCVVLSLLTLVALNT